MRWILCSFLAVFLASPAAATTVDFTTAFWHGANPVELGLGALSRPGR